MEMWIFVVFSPQVLDKFRVEYHYGDINSNNRLLAAPDRPLKFRFVERV